MSGVRSGAERSASPVVVLGGGPDAERAVSVKSAGAVAGALREAGHAVELVELEAGAARSLDEASVRGWPAGVIFPVLHGRWGEGGPLQRLLEASGRGFVGCGSAAAALAMDKLGTKLHAGRRGVPTAEAVVLDPRCRWCPLPLPVVVKPNRDGSSVGLRLCRSEAEFAEAVEASREVDDAWLVEAMVRGRELTVGLIDDGCGALKALPVVEIAAASGVYDHAAKYERGDTRYTVGPELPVGVADRVRGHAESLGRTMGLRHLSRVDFLLDERGGEWLLEVNTMPGFTASSLLPMAARGAGLEMPALVSRLVGLAADESR